MKLKHLSIIFLLLPLLFTSCVKDELFIGPATIEKVSFLPEIPKSTDDVVVTVKALDLKEITSLTLFYRTSTTGAFKTVVMTAFPDFLYKGTIPASAMGTKVEYYISAKNIGGFTTLYPSEAPTKLSSYTVGASDQIKLYINEVFSDGTKDTSDPDWVEIYNGSDIQIDLSGYAFYDDGIKTSGKAKRILNAGTVIPAKGFLVLKTEYTNGEYAVEFGLSTSGDGAYLDNPSGVLVASLDFLTISLSGKKSYGRQPDGSTNLVVFTNPTKGASNN